MTIEPKLATEANLSFVKVQALRNIHDNLLSAKAFCQGNLNIATALAAVRDVPRETSQDVQSHQSKLKACIESSEVLQGRVQNAIGLVCICPPDLLPHALTYAM